MSFCAASPATLTVAAKIAIVIAVTLHRSIARALINRYCHSVHTCRAATTSHTIAPSGPANACSAGQRSGITATNGSSSTSSEKHGSTSSPSRGRVRLVVPLGALR